VKTFIFFIWMFYAGEREPQIASMGPYSDYDTCNSEMEFYRDEYEYDTRVTSKHVTGCTEFVNVEE
jgi:hypothetical protein